MAGMKGIEPSPMRKTGDGSKGVWGVAVIIITTTKWYQSSLFFAFLNKFLTGRNKGRS